MAIQKPFPPCRHFFYFLPNQSFYKSTDFAPGGSTGGFHCFLSLTDQTIPPLGKCVSVGEGRSVLCGCRYPTFIELCIDATVLRSFRMHLSDISTIDQTKNAVNVVDECNLNASGTIAWPDCSQCHL